ncbi:MAG: FHA domain-containing protein [Caldilineaceae bacterium]
MADFTEYKIVGRESSWIKRILRPLQRWLKRFRQRGELHHQVTIVKAPAWHEPCLPTLPTAGFRRHSPQNSVAAPLRPRQAQPYGWALKVIAGPHAGQDFELTQLPALLGRAEAATVRLVQDKYVSRRHAELYNQQKTLRLCDLQSKQGTRINGRSVEDQILLVGDEIQVGQSILVVEQRGVMVQVTPQQQ